MNRDKDVPPKWLIYFEVYCAKLATWFVESNFRMSAIVFIALAAGIICEYCFDIEMSFQRSGCFLVAIALFFAFGEVTNSRMINSTLPAVRAHYNGNEDAKQHVKDLESQGDKLEGANLRISGWQFFSQYWEH